MDFNSSPQFFENKDEQIPDLNIFGVDPMANVGSFVDLLNSVGHQDFNPSLRDAFDKVPELRPMSLQDIDENASISLSKASSNEGDMESYVLDSSRSFSCFQHGDVESTEEDFSSKQKNKNSVGEEANVDRSAEMRQNVFKPMIGMECESIEDVYELYNTYSWVMGFSVRSGDNYINKNNILTMKEYQCQRAVFSKNAKISTTRCGCKSMIRVSRHENSALYVKVFIEEHNHELLESCGEKKYLSSHKHIDKNTKEIIRHLKENNASLSRLSSFMGSYFGSMEKVPFNKKDLRIICSDFARDSPDEDVRKTLEMFHEKIASDPKFVFYAHVDNEIV